ncbi:hypothetical protein [Actinoplanes missouriensis]
MTTYAYTDAGRLRSQTNGEGDRTSYSYSKKGVLEKLVTARGNEPGADPAQYTWTFHYDGNNNPVRRTHPNPGGGEVTRDTGWDELDRAVTQTDPLGAKSSAAYDNNNVTSVDDPARARTQFTYDKNNRPSDVTDSRQGRVHTDYDPAGNLTTTTDPLGNVTAAFYDAINRVVTGIDANKHITRYAYDDADQLTSVVAPDATDGRGTGYSYDANGAVTEVRDPLQHTRTAIYDRAGRVVATTDALGRSANTSTTPRVTSSRRSSPVPSPIRATRAATRNATSTPSPTATTSWAASPRPSSAPPGRSTPHPRTPTSTATCCAPSTPPASPCSTP